MRYLADLAGDTPGIFYGHRFFGVGEANNHACRAQKLHRCCEVAQGVCADPLIIAVNLHYLAFRHPHADCIEPPKQGSVPSHFRRTMVQLERLIDEYS